MTYPPNTLEDFIDFCKTACGQNDDNDQANGLFMVEDTQLEPGVLVAVVGPQDDASDLAEIVEALFVGQPRQFAALASRIGWSPDDVTPTTLAWVLTCIEADKPAAICVKRVVEDRNWWRMPAAHAPWFVLSTAGSLRKKLQGDTEPLRVRDAQDRSLFERPGHGPVPRVHGDGMI